MDTMKRQLHFLHGKPCLAATPASKRLKQTSICVTTPVSGLTEGKVETPDSDLSTRNSIEFPATTEKRLASFSIQTPTLLEGKLSPKRGKCTRLPGTIVGRHRLSSMQPAAQPTCSTPTFIVHGKAPNCDEQDGPYVCELDSPIVIDGSPEAQDHQKEEEEEEFVIRSSQLATPPGGADAYVRPSQAVLSEDDFVIRSSQCLIRCSQTFGGGFASPESYTEMPDANDTCPTPVAFASLPTPADPVSSIAASEETNTPELEVCGTQCEPLSSQQEEVEDNTQVVLFPIFRPKRQRKFICVIRHGESEYNRADSMGKAWSDPDLFDARLTSKGHQQAKSIRRDVLDLLMRKKDELGEPLWLMSPLTRCIETFLDACPHPERVGAPPGGDVVPLPLLVLPVIAEHCITTGDVGRPTSHLIKDFPKLAGALTGIPDAWWYCADKEQPNCSLSRNFNHSEKTSHMKQRVAEFSRWLHTRQENFIIAFGHCTFWKHFTNARRLRNCEMFCMYW